jgi:hypothetical protein
VLVCAGHGPSPLPHLGAIFRDFTPLCSTGLFQYKACRRKKQEFFSAVFCFKNSDFIEKLAFSALKHTFYSIFPPEIFPLSRKISGMLSASPPISCTTRELSFAGLPE